MKMYDKNNGKDVELLYSLSNVELPTSWGDVTNTSYMFHNCSNLKQDELNDKTIAEIKKWD